MKITGFSASPRKNGNTDTLVNAILRGAAMSGAETEFIRISDLQISPCRHCENCRSHENCLIDDDMQKIYYRLMESDAVILGSPVYMWQMSAQAKTFVDRMLALLDPELNPRLKPGKRMVLAFTQGQPVEDTFSVYFEHTRKMMHFMGFEHVDLLASGGNREKDDLKNKPEVLKNAEQLGKKLALRT